MMQDNRKKTLTGLQDLQDSYWLKVELITFCKEHYLSTVGSKSDLIKRINVFLSTGCKRSPKIQKKRDKDSFLKITLNTPVIHYHNYAETRKFFIEHIGKRFKFNSYLRQFTNPGVIKPGMTYGDLIEGWSAFEKEIKKAPKKIPEQFEYNQFIQDFFAHETSTRLKDAIAAWKRLKSQKGPMTYAQFKATS